ncbi:hypothetical protein [Calothrix sp. PCC 7507]|nr:hypothetical protein [Calothrix sp. PCC 7507]
MQCSDVQKVPTTTAVACSVIEDIGTFTRNDKVILGYDISTIEKVVVSI